MKPFVFKIQQTFTANRHTKKLVKAVSVGQAIIPAEMVDAMNTVVASTGGRNDPMQQIKQVRP
jgi:hypothetical protein